ncbi:MAG: S1 family peptidase [Propionibacteriaceae bacterium]|nr:S1 family peptidase [Propionibacteriaceae bacterium]
MSWFRAAAATAAVACMWSAGLSGSAFAAPAADESPSPVGEVRELYLNGAWNETDDTAPLRPGKGIVLDSNPADPSNAGIACTSSFLAHDAAGDLFMLTAGHCAPNGSTVTIGRSSGTPVGTVSANGFWGNDVVVADAARVQFTKPGEYGTVATVEYKPEIFVGTGTILPVAGAVTVAVGDTVCTRGARTDTEACGTVASVGQSGQFTSPKGDGSIVTIEGLIDVTLNARSLSQGGDSGAPVYRKNADGTVAAVGLVTGGLDSTMSVTPIDRVLAATGTELLTMTAATEYYTPTTRTPPTPVAEPAAEPVVVEAPAVEQVSELTPIDMPTFETTIPSYVEPSFEPEPEPEPVVAPTTETPAPAPAPTTQPPAPAPTTEAPAPAPAPTTAAPTTEAPAPAPAPVASNPWNVWNPIARMQANIRQTVYGWLSNFVPVSAFGWLAWMSGW